ncbi:WXG100 family type VII secretion target [Nocardia wallacei]|uniref:WXG100 family type VII secretion target n=1 Tax=Nocardia wallacei TaxID=480035 RepID=UPI0024567DB3|nr:WXG100 family type VII secretion target [Nocardia wallacei]
MTDPVEVAPEDVHAAADWLEASAREFATDLGNLMREVRSFVGGDWNGPAAGTHGEAWDEWEQGARQVLTGLEHDAAALRHAAASFRGTEQGSASAITATDPGVI